MRVLPREFAQRGPRLRRRDGRVHVGAAAVKPSRKRAQCIDSGRALPYSVPPQYGEDAGRKMIGSTRLLLIGAAMLGVAMTGADKAVALDKVHAGKAVAVAWSFIPLDVGVAEGIYAKYGLDVDITAFGGDAKLQQGLASGSTDFGLGSGPGMAFVAK